MCSLPFGKNQLGPVARKIERRCPSSHPKTTKEPLHFPLHPACSACCHDCHPSVNSEFARPSNPPTVNARASMPCRSAGPWKSHQYGRPSHLLKTVFLPIWLNLLNGAGAQRAHIGLPSICRLSCLFLHLQRFIPRVQCDVLGREDGRSMSSGFVA